MKIVLDFPPTMCYADPMKNGETETTWLTNVSQVPNVNDASLKRALISLDGCGQRIKTEALEELLRRTKQECQEELNALRNKIEDLESQLIEMGDRIDYLEDREE